MHWYLKMIADQNKTISILVAILKLHDESVFVNYKHYICLWSFQTVHIYIESENAAWRNMPLDFHPVIFHFKWGYQAKWIETKWSKISNALLHHTWLGHGYDWYRQTLLQLNNKMPQ